jgi:CubicO group peptidase (beta-lactamase class C family)
VIGGGGDPTLPEVDAALEAGLAAGISPALAAVVLRGGRLAHRSARGNLGARPLSPDDLFDVASLTKVMATGTAAARLAAAGALDLEAPAGRWLPGFGGDKAQVTVRHLLAHTSGLPAWRPFSLSVDRHPECPAMAMEAAIAAEPLLASPGSRAVYSDLGFIALGMVLERAAGAPLDVLFDDRVAEPLGLRDSFFLPARAPRLAKARRAGRVFVPTVVRETGEVREGAVHDDNARALGGVAGHAGLFASAGDVARLGQAWLDAWAGRSAFLPRATARLFAARDAAPGSTRALAWDTPSARGSAIGSRLGRRPAGAIGHLAFTGCSLWIDLGAELVCALLTSHCPRPGEVEPMRSYRRRFHDAVAEALAV